jgi:hypothetical protein
LNLSARTGRVKPRATQVEWRRHGQAPKSRRHEVAEPNPETAEEGARLGDFSSLDAKGRKTALQAANRARCNCGCGMQLAQCVATDSTCPIRADNIEKIKTMVREAMPQSSSRHF